MSPDDETPSAPAEEEDFAALFAASLQPAVFEIGQLLQGVVVLIARDVVFLDVGGKGEATMDLTELQIEDGEVTVEVGATVEGVVVSTAGGIKLSHKLVQGAATRRQVEEAYRAKLPVEGRVESVNKGGYEVRIGGQRAFCPMSQIDTAFTSDPEVHVGQVYTFRILEYKDEGGDLVVSRRALIEEEEREQEADVRKTIIPGADVPGRIVSVRPYGAFVDLGGGIQGLLHVSEMGWSRVSDPSTVVQAGDTVTVRVLGVDNEKGKISLGMRQLQTDPWDAVGPSYASGQRLTGTVTRVVEFGAFIELQPGIEALAHLSTFPPTGKRDAWKDAVSVGATVAVEILTVDLDKKRIGVAVIAKDAALVVVIEAGAQVTGTVDRHERYGVFVFLSPGRTGLMPNEESDTAYGTDLKQAFPIGSEIQVVVLEVDPDSHRIRLSRKAIREVAEGDDARAYSKRQIKEQDATFGSMADKLRAAFRPAGD
ncbi:MAG: S1 RNA-binding domain-containing protein [Vicinamibacterales bacterium]|nr:S1 RNA-binding domain-containing protein [Vicinamibacterales bacterium]